MDRKTGMIFLAIYLLTAGAGLVAWSDRDEQGSVADRPSAASEEPEPSIVEGQSLKDARSAVQGGGDKASSSPGLLLRAVTSSG